MTYPPTGQPFPPPYYGAPGQLQRRGGSGFAVASLVLGLLGCFIGWIPFVGLVSFLLGLVGIVFGVIGLAGNRAGKGIAVAGTVLSVLAIALAVVGVILLAAVVDDVDESIDNVSGENTTQVLERQLDVQIGQLVSGGDEAFPTATLPVALRNKGDETHSFSVTVEAQDAQGNRIEDDTVYANGLAAGQSVTKDAFTLVTGDKLPALASAKFVVTRAAVF